MNSQFIFLSKLKELDQRYFQIAFLFGLTCYGGLVLHIPHLTLAYVGTIFVSSQIFQWLFSRSVGIPYDFRSSLISTFSLSLLVSSQSLLIGVLAAGLMVGSKFLLRVNDKHIFNPANFALIVCVLVFPNLASIQPGQWSEAAVLSSFVVAVCGLLVTGSIRRYDIAFYFLGCQFIASTTSVLLGYLTWSQVGAQFSSVALLLFTFFMITDPKTIPNTNVGRLIYAAFCAGFGAVLQFVVGVGPGFVYALFVAALFLPVIDTIFKGESFQWKSRQIVK